MNRETRRARARNGSEGPREMPVPKDGAAMIVEADAALKQAAKERQLVVNAVLRGMGCDLDREDGLEWNVSNKTGQMIARLAPPEHEAPIPPEIQALLEAPPPSPPEGKAN